MKKNIFLFLVLIFIVDQSIASTLDGVNAGFLSNWKSWLMWVVGIAAGIAIAILAISNIFSMQLPQMGNNILQVLIALLLIIWAGTFVTNLFVGKGSGFLLH